MQKKKKKKNAKLKALVGFVPYMGLVKKKLQINSFFAAQLNYWMIHSRFKSHRIKCLHERYLRLI